MKIRRFILELSLLLAFESLQAEENKGGSIWFYTDDRCDTRITVTKDCITETHEDFGGKDETYPREALMLLDDGYYYFRTESGKAVPFIYGNGWFGFYIDEEDPYFMHMKKWYEDCEEEGSYYALSRYDGIRPVFTSSSFLREGKILYEASNLGKLFYPTDCIDLLKPYWNPGHKPWVEGVKGNGEGEYIDLEADKSFDSMKILNGYVDLERLDLYKKNSRVKTFIVEDLDNNIRSEITFADEVSFQEFHLSKPTTHVRLTIKEVYPGNKYEDTCVSSILVH